MQTASRADRVFTVFLSVFFARYLKTDAARITTLDIEIFRDESWKSVYFGVKKSKAKVPSHKNIAGLSLCTFVSASCFSYCVLVSFS